MSLTLWIALSLSAEVIWARDVICGAHTTLLQFESAPPSGLETGTSSGMGFLHLYNLGSNSNTPHVPCKQRFMITLGGLISGRSITENSLGWEVQHLELRLGGGLGLIQRLGRGTLGLLIGGGLVSLSESQIRHQSERLKSVQGFIEQNSSESSLYQSHLWLGELILRPLILLDLIELHQMSVGMGVAGELARRILSSQLSTQLESRGLSSAWAWGVHIGLFLRWGGE